MRDAFIFWITKPLAEFAMAVMILLAIGLVMLFFAGISAIQERLRRRRHRQEGND